MNMLPAVPSFVKSTPVMYFCCVPVGTGPRLAKPGSTELLKTYAVSAVPGKRPASGSPASGQRSYQTFAVGVNPIILFWYQISNACGVLAVMSAIMLSLPSNGLHQTLSDFASQPT